MKKNLLKSSVTENQNTFVKNYHRLEILLVEDSEDLAFVYQAYLNKNSYDVHHVVNGQDALRFLAENKPAAVLLDLQLPDIQGVEVLKKIREIDAHMPVVVITAYGTIEIAVEAMRLGAQDFINKPFGADRLIVTLANVLEKQQLSGMLDKYRETFDRKGYQGFIGNSLPMQAMYQMIESSGSSSASVFITGESGTGKELCAEAIHNQSKRKHKAFIALNCGAIPKDLMESQIFGHVKGAFTGAITNREGAATSANGGTLFLDEIGDMDLQLQVKLLRFIQTGKFNRVGSDKTEIVDIRFISATHRDPLAEVAQGNFREDLYYRLHVIPIQIPPLRERGNDIITIARSFLRDYSKEEGKQFKCFTEDAESEFVRYAWPGNVRQLQNVIRSIVVLNQGKEITREMLPSYLLHDQAQVSPENKLKAVPNVSDTRNNSSDNAAGPKMIRPLRHVELEVIQNAIDACDGNVPRAAAMLEISASTIYRKRDKLTGLIE